MPSGLKVVAIVVKGTMQSKIKLDIPLIIGLDSIKQGKPSTLIKCNILFNFSSIIELESVTPALKFEDLIKKMQEDILN